MVREHVRRERQKETKIRREREEATTSTEVNHNAMKKNLKDTEGNANHGSK